MHEFPIQESEKKPVDELVLKRGHHHQKDLQAVVEKLKLSFNDPELFSSESQRELDEWMENNEAEALEKARKIYEELEGMESTHSPAHDLSHLMDNLNSAVRIFEEYGNLSEAEKLEIALSCLGHDLGRYVESELDKMNPKDTLFLMPAMVGRKIKGITELPRTLQLRLLYDIASGSVPHTGRRTADTVHQCDREYTAGSAAVPRYLAFDVALAGRELMVPRNEQLETRLPMPETEGKWFLVEMEFFMRNVYPPVSPRGEEAINRMKQENAVIEMLATEGKEAEFRQVFTPELGLKSAEEIHWSKKPIPKEVFESAQKEKEEFLKQLDADRYVPGKEAESIKRIVDSDKISLSPNFYEIIQEKLAHCTLQERKNLWMVAEYALHKRHERRIHDLERLNVYVKDGGVAAMLADWLIKELNSREEIFAQFN